MRAGPAESRRRSVILGLSLLGLALFATPAIEAAERSEPFVVGIITDGIDPARRLQSDLVTRTIDAVESLTRGEFDVRFPESKRLQGDWTVDGANRLFQQLVNDPEVDLVLTMGPLSSGIASLSTRLPKPVIAPFAIDISAQGLPNRLDDDGRAVTGVPNLVYLATQGDISDDLAAFQELAGVEQVHILIDRVFVDYLPKLNEVLDSASRSSNVAITVVPVDEDPQTALDQLPREAEGVYLTPLPRTSAESFRKLIDGLNERALPTFSLSGHNEVRQGVLAGLRPDADNERLARRTALSIQRILLGEDAGTLPVLIDVEVRMMINIPTAVEIGFYPSWDFLFSAELYGAEDAVPSRPLTLSEAVQAAVDSNIELQAADREVAAGYEDVASARAQRRPQIDLSATGLQVDEDTAENSFGSQPERTLTGSLTVSQLLFSDAANAAVTIADRQQVSLIWEREQLRLDIALEAATAFLNVLRAATLERVARDTLGLTESNLALARRRREVGYSGPADVYRWESRQATDRADVIAAFNDANAARVALNQTMNRPLEDRFDTIEPILDDPLFVTCCERLAPYANDPASYRLFREFLVGEGLNNSIELRVLDAQIQAQERAVLAARRDFWAPDISLQGTAERVISRAGAGENPTAFPIDIERNSWNVGVGASLPLFQGGARFATYRQAQEQLNQLQRQRALIIQQVEQRIRSAAFEAGATFPAIELNQQAAAAARKNLELITDSYSKGLVSVIDLLDAQNASQQAEAAAANAVFDFMVDLMEVQRATNTFDFFISSDQRQAWLDRLDAYFKANRRRFQTRWR